MILLLQFLITACLFSLPCFASYSLSTLSLEEKVGQILIAHFNGETLNNNAKTLIENIHVGGIVYYNWANGLTSPEQVRKLSSDLQSLSKIPLFISTDQEGGLIARLTTGFTIFPGNKALGITKSLSLAEDCAFAIGQELNNVGINMNFAPVVDINNNPRNPVIGIRSFSDSAEIVTAFGKSTLKGYHKTNTITSLKHFPGHGDVDIDSHESLPIIKKTKEELQLNEFFPFSALAAEADTIMTAHVMIPSLDPIYCATLSKTILTILREEIGFKGIILSDSLIMEGLLKNGSSIEELAIQAFNAGCDMLILGGKQLIGTRINYELTINDVKKIHQSLIQAVKSGHISEKKLDESVERILTLKAKHSLLPSNNNQTMHSDEHHELAKKIATLALRVHKNTSSSLCSISDYNLAIFASELTRDSIENTSLLTLGKNSTSLFFKSISPTEEEIKAAYALTEKSDLLLFCSYNAWQNPSQTALIESLLKMKKPFILLALRDPLDTELFPKATLTIATFSPTVPSIQAAYDYLKTSFEK
jgi:beta-N-acetylhexosaminidase